MTIRDVPPFVYFEILEDCCDISSGTIAVKVGDGSIVLLSEAPDRYDTPPADVLELRCRILQPDESFKVTIPKEEFVKCLICGKVLDVFSDDLYSEATIIYTICNYGSRFDTNKFVFGLCDDCIQKKVDEGLLIKTEDI